MEDTASHETVYKLAHRADKANFLAFCDSLTLEDVLETVPKTIEYSFDSDL